MNASNDSWVVNAPNVTTTAKASDRLVRNASNANVDSLSTTKMPARNADGLFGNANNGGNFSNASNVILDRDAISMSTTTLGVEEVAIVSGAVSFVAEGATVAQLESAVKAMLAAFLGLDGRLIVVTVAHSESRLLSTSDDQRDSPNGRRLSTAWTAAYQARVPVSQVAAVESAALAASEDTSQVASVLKEQLLALGVDLAALESLVVQSFPRVTVTMPTTTVTNTSTTTATITTTTTATVTATSVSSTTYTITRTTTTYTTVTSFTTSATTRTNSSTATATSTTTNTSTTSVTSTSSTTYTLTRTHTATTSSTTTSTSTLTRTTTNTSTATQTSTTTYTTTTSMTTTSSTTDTATTTRTSTITSSTFTNTTMTSTWTTRTHSATTTATFTTSTTDTNTTSVTSTDTSTTTVTHTSTASTTYTTTATNTSTATVTSTTSFTNTSTSMTTTSSTYTTTVTITSTETSSTTTSMTNTSTSVTSTSTTYTISLTSTTSETSTSSTSLTNTSTSLTSTSRTFTTSRTYTTTQTSSTTSSSTVTITSATSSSTTYTTSITNTSTTQSETSITSTNTSTSLTTTTTSLTLTSTTRTRTSSTTFTTTTTYTSSTTSSSTSLSSSTTTYTATSTSTSATTITNTSTTSTTSLTNTSTSVTGTTTSHTTTSTNSNTSTSMSSSSTTTSVTTTTTSTTNSSTTSTTSQTTTSTTFTDTSTSITQTTSTSTITSSTTSTNTKTSTTSSVSTTSSSLTSSTSTSSTTSSTSTSTSTTTNTSTSTSSATNTSTTISVSSTSSTFTSTTSTVLDAAFVSGSLKFQVSGQSSEQVQIASEHAIATVLAVGVWQLNTTVSRTQQIPTQWYVATLAADCNTVCASQGGTCDYNAMLAGANNQVATQQAYEAAGFACGGWGTGCIPSNCPSFGAPYLHASYFTGSTATRDGRASPCFYGNQVAPCDQVPVDKLHRRLCACAYADAASAPSTAKVRTVWHVSYSLLLEGSLLWNLQVAAAAAAANFTELGQILTSELAAVGASEDELLSSFEMLDFASPRLDLAPAELLNSTSTTVTSSTTTSTVLVYLVLKNATLVDSFTTVELTFNRPARYGPASGSQENMQANCAPLAFNGSTWLAFGSSPSCTWSKDNTTLSVRFGQRATLLLGEHVVTAPEGFEPDGNVAFLPVPSLNVTVTTEDAIPQVTASLQASPTFPQSCSDVTFSALSSYGSAGRPFTLRWSFGAQTYFYLTRWLDPVIANAHANFSSLPTLTFQAQEFATAIRAVRNLLGEITFREETIHLQIEVKVTNWLGASMNAFAMVQVDKGDEPMPQIAPTTPSQLQIINSQEAEFAISTRYIDPALCGQFGLSVSQPRVTIDWEYRQFNGADWSRLDNSNGMLPRDLARSPAIVRFGSFAFEPNTMHQIRAQAAFVTSSAEARRPVVTFNLTVGPRASPVAQILGPPLASSACAFTLDASQSYDPGYPPFGGAALSFRWTCQPADKNNFEQAAVQVTACNHLSNFGPDKFDRTDGRGASGAQMTIAGGHLPEGLYNFSVSVWRVNESLAQASNKIYQLAIRKSALPPVSITVPWPMNGQVSTQVGGRLSSPVGLVRGEEECPIPETWAWSWALIEENTGKLLTFLPTSSLRRNFTERLSIGADPQQFLGTDEGSDARQLRRLSSGEGSFRNDNQSDQSLNASSADSDDTTTLTSTTITASSTSRSWTSTSTSKTSTTTTTGPAYQEVHVTELALRPESFPGNLMVAGSRYSYALLMTNSSLIMNQLQAKAEFDLDSAASSGAVITRSVPFTADDPPMSGICEGAPFSGEAVLAKFTFRTEGWIDEYESGLEFAFWRFPGSEAFHLSSLDWNNYSSDAYWSRQGGVLLRSWSSSKSLQDISMAAGTYTLVARARDVNMGTGSAAFVGLAVTAPLLGVSSREAVDVLDATFAGNDPDSIMNAVDSVNSVSIQGGYGNQLMVAEKALEALSTALTMIDATDDGLQKMSQVLTGVVSGRGGLRDSTALTQAADVLEGCIDLSLADGVNDAAGSSLLGSITAMGNGNSRNFGGKAASTDVLFANRITDLTSKLGDAALSRLLIGETVTLSSVDASGKGSSLAVAKMDISAVLKAGVSVGGLSVPLSALVVEPKPEPNSNATGNVSNSSNRSNASNASIPSRIVDAIVTEPGLDSDNSSVLDFGNGSVLDSDNGSDSDSANVITSVGADASARALGTLSEAGVVKVVSRRLAFNLAVVGKGCNAGLGVKQTSWLFSNPYGWADRALGINDLVSINADVKIVELNICGAVVALSDLADPLRITLSMPTKGVPPPGYGLEAACLIWNGSIRQWNAVGSVEQPVADDASEVVCLAPVGGGAYTAIWLPFLLPTTTVTTTTVTKTSSTNTMDLWTKTSSTLTPGPTTTSFTTTSTTIPWWATTITTVVGGAVGAFCAADDMPPLPESAAAFICYGPERVGQVCRARCEKNDPLSWEAAITCQSDTTWAVFSSCPIPTPVNTLVPTEAPSFDMVFLVLAMGGIGCFMALILIACGIYFAFRGLHSKVGADDEVLAEEASAGRKDDQIQASAIPLEPMPAMSQMPENNLQLDPHFWEWANEWTNSRSDEMSPSRLQIAASGTERPLSPPPLPPLLSDAEPASMAPPHEAVAEESKRQAQGAATIDVHADPLFWEWAREWAHLRGSSENPDPAADMPPPPLLRRAEEQVGLEAQVKKQEEVFPEDTEVMEEGWQPHAIALPQTDSLRAIADSRIDVLSDVRMPTPPDIPALPDITSSTQDSTQETSLVAFTQQLLVAVNRGPAASLDAPGSSLILPTRTMQGRRGPQLFRNAVSQNSHQSDPDDFPRPPALSFHRLNNL
eukprot:TRINITY_DN6797_c0_g2_i1.p1 TRINITY_DN6797_c0_g2~~TRINITY_DN6797_c0_g2_i1.p1  ORF type:complete len:2869 (+),score=356.36 TRINITY_DN6797_c0_g2_i1:77-8608(+)